jgi:Glycosyltransferase family 17
MVEMRRVFDTFTFCDELDLLEARFTELDSAVYRHVLVEAPVTFQGNPKPLYYQENQDRFAPWKDKIIHVVADLDGCRGHWAREDASRAAISQGLGELGDDDILLLGDVDEIPHPDFLQTAPGRLMFMRHHMLAVNLMDVGWWAGTAGTLGRSPFPSMQYFRNRQAGENRPFLASATGFPVITGWHFSWLGGPAAMRAKVHSFSHPEYAVNIDASADLIYQGKLNPVNGEHLVEVVIDDTFPKYMQERRGPANWYWQGK